MDTTFEVMDENEKNDENNCDSTECADENGKRKRTNVSLKKSLFLFVQKIYLTFFLIYTKLFVIFSNHVFKNVFYLKHKVE